MDKGKQGGVEAEPGKIDFSGPVKRYWALVDGSSREYLNRDLDEDTLPESTGHLWRIVAPKWPVTVAVREMMSAYAGKALTWETRRAVFWRLAMAFGLLVENATVENQFVPRKTYWTGLRVLDAWYAPPSRSGASMVDLSMIVYGGVFAGLDFVQRMSWRWLTRVLAWDVGFARFKPVRIGELVQARLIGLLDTTEPGRPKMTEYRPKSGIKTFNRGLRKERETCRLGFQGKECWDCHMGYAYEAGIMDPCPKATHSRRWVQRPCRRCAQDGWFDPGYHTPVCLRCVAHENYLKHRLGG